MIITWSVLPSDWSFVYNLETLYNENIADIVILNQNFIDYKLDITILNFVIDSSYERTKYVKIDKNQFLLITQIFFELQP